MASIVLPKPEHKPTLTIEEAAKVLGLGRSTAYRYARQGLIPSIRIGSQVRVPNAALREFLNIYK
jgi:excisionase family DNA binding protein